MWIGSLGPRMFWGTRATNFSIYTTKMEGAGPIILSTGTKFKRVPCQKNCRVNRAIVFLDKDKETWIILKELFAIQAVSMKEYYVNNRKIDLRSGLKRLYPNHKVDQVNIVLDFLGHYNKQLLEDLEK